MQNLSIGCVGCYTTLLDIKKCTNIKDLTINGYIHEIQPAYEVTQNEYGKELTEADSFRIEEELKIIIPKLKNLTDFAYFVYSENSDIRCWEFLKSCSDLVYIVIYSSDVTDYSFLNSMKDLKMVDLSRSQISTADSLVNLQNPMRLCIYDTPLAENEEEIQKLCEALPNTEILISGDRVENEQHWDLHEYYSRD